MTGGGLLCVLGVALIAATHPALRRFTPAAPEQAPDLAPDPAPDLHRVPEITAGKPAAA
jgi:hypothetical protein